MMSISAMNRVPVTVGKRFVPETVLSLSGAGVAQRGIFSPRKPTSGCAGFLFFHAF